MDITIATILAADGITNGAVYAMLSLALVLVFAVTRVIFIPQGEFISYGALTLASLQMGKVPGTLWLLLIFGALAVLLELYKAQKEQRLAQSIPMLLAMVAGGITLTALTLWLAPQKPSYLLQILLTFVLVTPLAPLLYRTVYQPIASATVLTLLIVSVAVHVTLTTVGLVFFGAEGVKTPALSDAREVLGPLSGQNLYVIVAAGVVMLLLYLFFEKSIYGKALRATAVNQLGARLSGINSNMAGMISFTVAGFMGVLGGILISPMVLIGYDSGFMVGLKGFVGAIIGGLASYPIAVLGAVLVGLIESFSTFYNSAWKDVIVFTLILPVLLWRSLNSRHHEEE